MPRSPHSAVALLALVALMRPVSGLAQVTLAASLGEQILQNVVFGSVKNELIGSLAGMGCRGATLAGMIALA